MELHAPHTSSRILLSWDDIDQAIGKLWQIIHDNKDSYLGIIAVARGGLVPAAMLAHRLKIRDIRTITVASYVHENRVEPFIGEVPVIGGSGSGWLIVDDLSDTGETLSIARRIFPSARTAVLYAKPLGKSLADYISGEFDQSEWVQFPWEKSTVNCS